MAFADPLLRARRTEALLEAGASATQRQALLAWYGVLKAKNSFKPDDLTSKLLGESMRSALRLQVVQDEDGWPTDYRHVSQGEIVEAFFGALEGTLVSEAYKDLYRFSVEPFYAGAVSVKAPALRHFTSATKSGAQITFSELVLPVEEESGEIVELLVIFNFGEAEAAEAGPLDLRAG